MTRRVILFAIALLVGVSLGYAFFHRAPPSPAVVIAHHDTERAAQAVARVDTVYRYDTAHVTRWLTRYDSTRVVDTVVRDSVVYVRREIADSTVQACRLLTTSCTASNAAKDTLIRSLRVELGAVQKASHPSFWSRAKHDALVAGLTVAIIKLAPHVRAP